MATAKDVIAHMIGNALVCTSCNPNATENEVARWDVETEDTCSECKRPLHADAKVYVIGSNMPGYMPDAEPYTLIGTFEDAKRSLIDTLNYEENSAINEAEAEEYCHAAEDVNLWSGPDSIEVGAYVYWITEQ